VLNFSPKGGEFVAINNPLSLLSDLLNNSLKDATSKGKFLQSTTRQMNNNQS